MSLRAFHVIFIVCSIFVTAGFSVWAYVNFQRLPAAGYLWTAVISLACAVGLAAYGTFFLRKIKE
ncbi:MAG: hypothetical protein A3C36_07910 [Omnitrophica WOR_2 bacterium RIFCSPHIGHO2_02_FULL_52_10]|nr:MAG: hypothetical protein A3C36_07910 [Omnitrophica WOR_2 bacterium RIFCSPHIGHO2_02_FULL_52_10]